jgi:outer membrane protein OmpA-like peptidoglycan-associated protein
MVFRASILSLALAAAAVTAASGQEVNLLALGEGATLASSPASYSTWPPHYILDDAPTSGWANATGKLTNNVFVIELPAAATLTAFEFDTAGIDGVGRGAKDVTVEVSSAAAAGYRTVLRATLSDKRDGQRFPAAERVAGSFVRLTVLNNHGDPEWTELMGLRGYGAKPQGQPIPNVSGIYKTNWNDFHVSQKGTALSGCYEYNEGVFEGTLEGRVAKLAWTQSDSTRGPAVFVFAPDGLSFRGYWWSDTDKGKPADGDWNGTRRAKDVGSCPHWTPSLSGELRKDLAATGRARLYGILFDLDSARLRTESLPTLDEVVRLLAAEPTWRVTIEGHTDSTGTGARNQTLSEQRAQSVKDYLTSKGVAGSRLASAGFGASKPVADNATELGRAQNRRVELVKK